MLNHTQWDYTESVPWHQQPRMEEPRMPHATTDLPGSSGPCLSWHKHIMIGQHCQNPVAKQNLVPQICSKQWLRPIVIRPQTSSCNTTLFQFIINVYKNKKTRNMRCTPMTVTVTGPRLAYLHDVNAGDVNLNGILGGRALWCDNNVAILSANQIAVLQLVRRERWMITR